MDDKYEHYNYEQDNLVNSGHSGKHRSKVIFFFLNYYQILFN